MATDITFTILKIVVDRKVTRQKRVLHVDKCVK